jgi:hypothetical protein
MLRKTAAFTAASIAGVILAGGAAVGANIGILNAADSNALGQLSAEAPLDVPTDTTPLIQTVASTDQSNVHTFTVDIAGTVSVESTDTGLRLVEVAANPGWTWEDTTSSADAVNVTFRSGGDTLEFAAVMKADGTIEPSVNRPALATAQPSAVTSNSSTSSFSDDEPDDHGEGEAEHEGRNYDD